MKITIQSTTRIVKANGIDCRVWEGLTESGIRVQALIPRIAAYSTDNLMEFEAELKQHEPPSEEPQAFPLRMVL